MGRIRNLDKLQKRLRSIGSTKAAKEVEGALFAGADLVAAEAGLSITRGAVSGKNHVASAPGQPPNADSHVLDKGIGVYPVAGKTADGIEVSVVSMARYSEALEFGSAPSPPARSTSSRIATTVHPSRPTSWRPMPAWPPSNC